MVFAWGVGMPEVFVVWEVCEKDYAKSRGNGIIMISLIYRR